MRDALLAVGAIARTSLRTRLRRPATLVLFLALAGLSWLVIPDLSGGHSLMTFGETRSLYDSNSLSVGTALLAALLMSLLGYYLLSSSLRQDLVTRTGFVAAATPTSNAAYLLGKWLGNCLYLGAVAGAYLACVMVMHFFRAERALRPDLYLWHYALLLGPLIAAVSAFAVAFEAIPGLGGRFGDLVYFFFWAFAFTLPAILLEKSGQRWLLALDFSGLGTAIDAYRRLADAHHGFSIGGGNTFNPANAPIPLPPLPFSLIGWRIAAALWPAALLAPATLLFRRFDPARVKVPAPGVGDGLFARLNRLVGRLTRPVLGPLLARLPGRAGREAALTFGLLPIAAPVVLASLLTGALAPGASLSGPPLALAVLTLVTLWSDLAPRDAACGVRGQLFSVAGLREGMIGVKLAAAAWLAALAAGPLLARLALHAPATALAALCGLAMFAAASVLLGALTASPKPFLAIGLLALYLSSNAGKDVPALDFFGGFDRATAGTMAGSAALAVLLSAGAALLWRWKLAREY